MVRVKMPPVDRFNGDKLTRELHAAGYSGCDVVQINGEVQISGLTPGGANIDERSRAKVEAIVNAHEYISMDEQVIQLRADLAAALARLAALEQRAVLKPVVGR